MGGEGGEGSRSVLCFWGLVFVSYSILSFMIGVFISGRGGVRVE